MKHSNGYSIFFHFLSYFYIFTRMDVFYPVELPTVKAYKNVIMSKPNHVRYIIKFINYILLNQRNDINRIIKIHLQQIPIMRNIFHTY